MVAALLHCLLPGGSPAQELDEIIALHVAQAALLEQYDVQFEASVVEVQNEEGLRTGAGEVLATVTGRMCRKGTSELLAVEFGDVFQMVPRMENGAVRSLMAPHPGPFVVLQDESFVLTLNALTGSGSLGIRGGSFPRQLFNPLQALGAVGSDAWCDPVHWLLNRSGDVPVSVQKDGALVRLRDGGPDGDAGWETSFDLERGAAVRGYRRCGEGGCTFDVDEFRAFGNGGWFPAHARARFANNGGFPCRCIFWEATSIEDKCDDDCLTVVLGGSGFTVTMGIDDPLKQAFLPPGSLLAPASLGRLRAAILGGDEEGEWSRATFWPARPAPGQTGQQARPSDDPPPSSASGDESGPTGDQVHGTEGDGDKLP